MKKIRLSMVMIGLAVLLGGCAKKPSPDNESSGPDFTAPGESDIVNEYPFDTSVPSVFVRRDGSVSSVDIEDFGAEYYDEEEFEKDYVIPAVSGYNQDRQGLSFSKADETEEKLGVAVNRIRLENEKLSLQLDYATADDYLGFNKKINELYAGWETFAICRYSELADKGFSADIELVDTEGNSVSADTVGTAQALHVCILGIGAELPSGFSGEFQFQGQVLYVSPDIYIQDENSVRVYGSDNLQYILFQ